MVGARGSGKRTREVPDAPARAALAAECDEVVTKPVTLGEVFLEVITTGVITDNEIAWVARNQGRFSRAEEATALRLGRLLDAGVVNSSGLTKPSTALVDQVRSIDKQRVRRRYGRVSPAELEAIDAGLCLYLGLEPEP